MAAARRMYDCSVVTLGPSLGSVFGWHTASLVGSEAGPSRHRSISSLPASGNRVDNGESGGSLITPRWIRREGRTLSENMGMLLVSGIGKGWGEREPKRIEMA